MAFLEWFCHEPRMFTQLAFCYVIDHVPGTDTSAMIGFLVPYTIHNKTVTTLDFTAGPPPVGAAFKIHQNRLYESNNIRR